jgi:hypothetical protein
MTEPAFTDNLSVICREPECSTWNVTGFESNALIRFIKAANVGREIIFDKTAIVLESLFTCYLRFICPKFFCH